MQCDKYIYVNRKDFFLYIETDRKTLQICQRLSEEVLIKFQIIYGAVILSIILKMIRKWLYI